MAYHGFILSQDGATSLRNLSKYLRHAFLSSKLTDKSTHQHTFIINTHTYHTYIRGGGRLIYDFIVSNLNVDT